MSHRLQPQNRSRRMQGKRMVFADAKGSGDGATGMTLKANK